MYITGFFHVIGLLLRKPGSFTIYFSTIQFSSFFFFSPVSLKQSPAATARRQAGRRRCNGRKMLPEWTKRVRHEQTRRRRQRQVCGGARHASTAGMKWRRNDDDERNLLIEYDSLAFQAENGKFSAHHDYYRMNWRGVPPSSPKSPHQCSVQRRTRRPRVAWRRWQPVEPKINFINRGSPHLIHQNEVTQIRVRKRVTINCAEPHLCRASPPRRYCVCLCLLIRRHADHAAAAIAACTAQDDIHEKKDKNTPLNEFPSGWLLKRLCLPISYDWKRLFLFT